MNIEQLRTLVAAVDEGAFDRAAARLQISPPAVSQRIKALESQTGRVLLRRSAPVRPTEPGEAVLRMARQVLSLHDSARVELGMDQAELTPLDVAVNADSLATWFRPVLAELAAPGTGISVRLRSEDQDHSRRLLFAGEVAAAITTSSAPVTGCRTIPLGAMVYEPRAAASLLEHAGPQPDLARLPVVVYDDKDDLQSAALHRAGITGRPPEHRVPSAEAFVRAIADGIGWGMVPRLQLPGTPFAAADTPLLPVPGLHPEAVSLHLQRWSTALPALAQLEDAVRRGARALL